MKLLYPRFKNATKYDEKYPNWLVKGTVTKVHAPEGVGFSRYTNHLFLDRVKAFQADLLYGDDRKANSSKIMDFEENHVKYKIFVDTIKDRDGKPAYVFAMTSLQPVNEAAGVMRDYYGYIVIATLLLVLLASFYYSRRIARPLLRINQTTQRITGLDFSEKIPVTTQMRSGICRVTSTNSPIGSIPISLGWSRISRRKNSWKTRGKNLYPGSPMN